MSAGLGLSSRARLPESPDPYRLSKLPSGLLLRQAHLPASQRQVSSARYQDLDRSRSVPRDPHSVLPSVSALRTLLRNRYSDKTNLMQIFSEWDRGRVGYIRPTDVVYMLHAMGVQITGNEASLLIASANKSHTGYLNLEEFRELIKSDASPPSTPLPPNADFTSLRHSLENQALKHQTDSMTSFLLQKFQSKLHQMTQNMLKKDKNGTGFITLEDFLMVVEGLKLPMECRSHWERIYGEYGGEQGLEIRRFVERLGGKQGIYAQEEGGKDGFVVLDSRSVPINKLETIENRSRRVKRLLKDHFQSEDSLCRALSACSGREITLRDLKEFVCSEAEMDPREAIGKEDIEGFLSVVLYNAYGKADVEAIAHSVFVEEYRDEMSTRKRRPLPPVNRLDVAPLTSSRRAELLNELGTKLYSQRCGQAFQAFRYCDIDNDGYVSREDFKTALKRLNIPFADYESDQLLDYLDEDKNGFLSYKEFANGLKINASRRELHSVLAAAKEMYQRQSEALKSSPSKTDASLQEGYAGKPQGHITRDVFQSPYSIDPESRFHRKNLSPISYTQEDRIKRQRQVDARLNVIQQFHSRQQHSIETIEKHTEDMQNRKLWQKAAAVENYARVKFMQRCRIFPS